MHITYENEIIEVDVIDDSIKEMIEQKKSNKRLIKGSIDSIKEMIEQQKNEQNELMMASAKFANFTRQNAIVAFNDDLDAYLELLINEEMSKKSAGSKNDQVLKGNQSNLFSTCNTRLNIKTRIKLKDYRACETTIKSRRRFSQTL